MMGHPSTASDDFTLVFWNVWMMNQLSDRRFSRLCRRLEDLIETHQPTAFGINEITAHRPTKQSRLNDFFAQQGYIHQLTTANPERANLSVGTALLSRRQPTATAEHVLGHDATAMLRGFPGHTINILEADIPIGQTSIKLIVNYWAHLVPYNWPSHLQHARTFRQLVKDRRYHNRTIIVGDFNEPKSMHGVRELGKIYHRRTGSFTDPTWRLLGQRFTLLRANYDNLFWSRDDNLKLKEFRILPRVPSDHAPLLATFRAS